MIESEFRELVRQLQKQTKGFAFGPLEDEDLEAFEKLEIKVMDDLIAIENLIDTILEGQP